MEAEPQAGSPSSGRVGGTGAGAWSQFWGWGAVWLRGLGLLLFFSVVSEMPGVECPVWPTGTPECVRALSCLAMVRVTGPSILQTLGREGGGCEERDQG